MSEKLKDLGTDTINLDLNDFDQNDEKDLTNPENDDQKPKKDEAEEDKSD